MSNQSTPPIPARFTYVQRKEIANLLPALADRMLLDCKYQRTLSFSPAELAEIKQRSIGAYQESDSGTRRNSLRLIRDSAQNAIERYELDMPTSAASVVYRFNVVLMDTDPAIWRRIEVPEGTLVDLHEHIQTAMGWTNSHLHQFIIDGKYYGDAKLLDDGWEDEDFIDSTKLSLGKLLEKKRKPFRFDYEYDFGDGWQHEIVYEGAQPKEAGSKYPRCIEGARACPPEDIGGTFGFQDFLEAIGDPKHKEHHNMLEWIGGRFDPEEFSTDVATKVMHRGLPEWRDYQ